MRPLACLLVVLPLATTTVYAACQRYSLSQIADAVRKSSNSSDTMKSNSCMWGGAAMAESGGNGCADNGNNYGVLQLTRSNLPSGVTPEAYKNMSLQQQVDIWAQYGGPEKQGSGYNYLTSNMGNSVNGVPITQGMLAACSQFGGLICAKNVAYLQQTGRCQSPGDGGVRATNATLRNRTANMDGNNQSICTWGKAIQQKIAASGCGGQGSTVCAPNGPSLPKGDYPKTPTTGAAGGQLASIAPSPQPTDIVVGSRMVMLDDSLPSGHH